jgi:tetratricopeptide (TPR) repeat protein
VTIGTRKASAAADLEQPRERASETGTEEFASSVDELPKWEDLPDSLTWGGWTSGPRGSYLGQLGLISSVLIFAVLLPVLLLMAGKLKGSWNDSARQQIAETRSATPSWHQLAAKALDRHRLSLPASWSASPSTDSRVPVETTQGHKPANVTVDAEPSDVRIASAIAFANGGIAQATPANSVKETNHTTPEIALELGASISGPLWTGTFAEGRAVPELPSCMRSGNDEMDTEKSAGLLKHGREFVTAGTIAQARLVFQRAAGACERDAVLELRANHDLVAPTAVIDDQDITIKTIGGTPGVSGRLIAPQQLIVADCAQRADNIGNAYEHKGNRDHAIASYDQAIKIDPECAAAFNNHGLVYQGKGDLEHAIADYDHAIKLDPKLAIAMVNRANAYKARGDLAHAIADYDQAIKLNLNDAVLFHNRGVVHQAKGQLDYAIGDYDQAIMLDPKYAKAFYNRGNAYKAKGDLAHAIADWNEALRLRLDPG